MTNVMKVILVALALLVSVPAFAETDYKAMPIIRDIQKGVKNQNAIKDLYVKDSVEIDGAVDVAGDVVIAGDTTIASNLTVSGTFAADSLSTVGVAYTPATMGGATNSPISLGITLPAGAIVRDGYVKAHSVLSDTDLAAAATISIGTIQDSYAGLYAAATNMLRTSGYHQLIPDYATAGDALYAASNLTVYVKTSVGAPTNGTWYVFLKYDMLP